MDPLLIPSYPKVSREIFCNYASQKREGSADEQNKAFRMLQSRKIVSLRPLTDEEQNVFVKAMIKNPMVNNLARQ